MKLTEKQIIKALKRLEHNWPAGLWLFSTGSSISLMRSHEDGTRHRGRPGTGMDPELEIASFQIPNDGGDW